MKEILNKIIKVLIIQIYMNYKIITILLLTLIQIYPKLTPLTSKHYKQTLLRQLTNTHHFVFVNRKLASSQFLQFLSSYAQDHKIQLYSCDPRDLQLKEYCKRQMPIFMIINTIRMEYTGRVGNYQDLKKWARFRIQQYPARLHSIQQIRSHVRDKNQIFCFVDREGEEITRKEYIFIAISKQMHFLYFCHLDASIGRQIGLTYGHLALIRQDLTTNYDYWSQKVQQDNEQLHRLWVNFLIRSFESQFRLSDRDKTHDLVTVYCDLSLQCEEELIDLYQYELTWRKKHPEINIIVSLIVGTEGEMKVEDGKIHDYPFLRFAKTKVQKNINHHKSGAVLEQTHYIRDVYRQKHTIINQNTLQVLLKQYQQKKLQFLITQSSIDIRPLIDQQATRHIQQKKKREQPQKNGKKLIQTEEL